MTTHITPAPTALASLPPVFVVVSVAADDPYGAEWLYGPYGARAVAERVAGAIAETHERICRVREVAWLHPGDAEDNRAAAAELVGRHWSAAALLEHVNHCPALSGDGQP